ncbi:hypothetical protein [Paraburkholderia pallida]|uniref:Uncharacterized protein n=1 Tax=Paraburkholderia pallida TaxID=2547399 RepID=A0A4P7DAC6_9BURK|nr:hypothetical protein [Paraburkholderia pallida]QBR03682.1 hypothetical protein E1956_42005 [Paraburkholderia pallida]
MRQTYLTFVTISVRVVAEITELLSRGDILTPHRRTSFGKSYQLQIGTPLAKILATTSQSFIAPRKLERLEQDGKTAEND